VNTLLRGGVEGQPPGSGFRVSFPAPKPVVVMRPEPFQQGSIGVPLVPDVDAY
jgi:hypothetical protein